MEQWQQHLKSAVTDTAELYDLLNLRQTVPLVRSSFALRVPRPFIERMQKGNPNDPLLLQVQVRADELKQVPGYQQDPLAESSSNPIPGLLHKYQGRVLIMLTGSCAVNCRYCFRRHFPYADNSGLAHWSRIIDYIKADPSINEVIFSGGDPLLVDDAKLSRLITDLEKIEHVTTLRIHTRTPVVIPQRITDALVSCLRETRLQSVVVLHINHANEIDATLQQKLRLLNEVATLLCQSVLLKGINDSVDALVQLSHRLFASSVLPYYLHQLDKTQGVHHFDVDEEVGINLVKALQARLPGYLVPRYVREVAGKASKVPFSL
ncbi:MAG: EF-P beta-lysylation protein EpmB [Coxiella sp. (in: Bacteria)]|nr:MAG: EF-P beta-lysylation protein EpmB [Coxiella sp. (in: g-proteobacteria)]